MSAAAIVRSRARHGVTLFGPTKPGNAWQRSAGGFEVDAFRLDWARERVACPAGRESLPWQTYRESLPWQTYDGTSDTHRAPSRDPFIKVRFSRQVCAACALRARCVRGASSGRQLILHPQPAHASA